MGCPFARLRRSAFSCMRLPFLICAVAGLAGCSRQSSVGSPGTSVSTTTATARPAAFTTVTFERTPCFGTCPVYRVSVSGSGSGNVRFEGLRNVDSVGTFTGTLPAASVSALGKAFDDAQYYAFDDKYGYGTANCPLYASDAQTIITSITTPQRTKRVEHDLGCANSPARLADLYRRFDEIVGTSRWIGRR